ncbi:hypothetical protein FPV16_14930 [Methylobacterium sp. W2]|uniref:hypothetical protein n=1 Tax=Methylobacterium sp. W2 TaxID=2598107 RepID=UPI001D0CCA00|nr:hypothetical protein [Methylobacterium sp. W2]MCC0807508.1 hypothetical protein [Methylobacterium sp. W2]
MPGLFDDFPDAPRDTGNTTTPKGLFDDFPDAKPAEGTLARVGTAAKGLGRALETGVDRGVAGLGGLPNAVLGLADHLMAPAARAIVRATGRTPTSEMPGGDTRPLIADGFPTQETVLSGMKAGKEVYKPQTTAEEYAQTVGEFLPGSFGPSAIAKGGAEVGKQIAKFAVAPALASETAGQATKGTALEPWVRGGAGLAAGLGAGAVGRRSSAERIFDRAAGTLKPNEVTQIQSLVSDASARGVPLSWPEAVQQVVGPNRLGDVMRVVEGEGGMADFFAKRPGQIRTAGGEALDAVAPAVASPARVGEAVQSAARSAVAGTPEGQAVIRATQGAGPRVTQDQAGQVIQREMRSVADQREAARSTQAATDYTAARNAPENVGIERTIEVERPGEPIVTQPAFSRPQFESGAPRPAEAFERPGAITDDPNGVSLARFIAKNGGLRLDGDAAATDLHRFMVPGVGKVARPDGKGLDNFWRERLIEEGYFRPDADGGMARDISSELLRKLQNEQRGVPSYPLDSAGRPKGRAAGGQAADDYANARSLAESRFDEDLARVEVDPKGIHPDIRERVVGALMRGEETDPLKAYERTIGAMKGPLDPYVKSTTVTETIPDVRYGQVNPQAALDAIDTQMRTAKGDVRGALVQTRKDMFGPGGETDLSVEGLLHARERLDQAISSARELGDATKVRDLMIARSTLDGQLKAVPEVAKADANFAANSKPIEPFTGNAPLGRVVQQDPLTKRMATPAEQVPSNLQGATAAREFLANATPAARRAFQDREVTRILDQVSGGEGGASASRLSAAMRQNEDVLAQLPEARSRLQRLAAAYRGREAVERSPLGKIAERPDAKAAIKVLFPDEVLEGSAQDITKAVQGLVRSDQKAARELVRIYLGTEFTKATKRLQSGPNQAGGAKFAAVIRGNALEAENLSAVLRALPGGETLNSGFSRFLDIMEATGQRQGIGSKTTFNTALREELKDGGLKRELAGAAATGGFKLPTRIMNAFDNWQAGKNVEELSRLFTTPEGGRRLAQLANAKPGASTIALLNRIVTLATHGGQSGTAESLRLPGRPIP